MADQQGKFVTWQAQEHSARGYLVLPPSQQGPGVLLLHAWWGLTPFFQEVADRLAADGFVVLAPDLYHQRTAETIEEAKALQATTDDALVNEELTSAVSFLLAQPATLGTQVGAVGFSMGGFVALTLEKDLAAIVTFYGPQSIENVTAQAAFQGHFAEFDEFDPPEVARQLADDLVASGREVDFYYYPGTHHWFFEANRADVYDPAAAQLAWERTLSFLHAHLTGSPKS